MAQIEGLIPQQSFEHVRDRIGAILADELQSQVNNFYNDDAEVSDVWVERWVPFDKTELPAVNVCLAQGELGSRTQIHTDGTYTYNIDCYHSAKSSDTEDGDSAAMIKLQRLIGICRAIVENPRFKTLGFAATFGIGNRGISNIGIGTAPKEDAVSVVMGRLQMVVRVPETTELKVPAVIAGYETQVKLALTEKGYRYESV